MVSLRASWLDYKLITLQLFPENKRWHFKTYFLGKVKKNIFFLLSMQSFNPVSILYKSIAGRYRPVRVADGPITARYRFNASWEVTNSTYRLILKALIKIAADDTDFVLYSFLRENEAWYFMWISKPSRRFTWNAYFYFLLCESFVSQTIPMKSRICSEKYKFLKNGFHLQRFCFALWWLIPWW